MNTSLPRLGIDISKLSFDACLQLPDGTARSAAFPNNPEGFDKLDAWLKAHAKPDPTAPSCSGTFTSKATACICSTRGGSRTSPAARAGASKPTVRTPLLSPPI